MQSIDSIETFACGTSKNKDEIKCNNIIKQYKKMINFDDVIEEGTIREHNTNWPQIPDHPCRTIIGDSGAAQKTHYLI